MLFGIQLTAETGSVPKPVYGFGTLKRIRFHTLHRFGFKYSTARLYLAAKSYLPATVLYSIAWQTVVFSVSIHLYWAKSLPLLWLNPVICTPPLPEEASLTPNPEETPVASDREC